KVPAKRSWAVSLACRHDKQIGLCGLSARAGDVRYTGRLGADGDDVTTGVHERLQQGGIGDRRSSSGHEEDVEILQVGHREFLTERSHLVSSDRIGHEAG